MPNPTKRRTRAPPGSPPASGMRWIAGGEFRMGSEDFYPEERPVHRVRVSGFWIDARPVTNAGFAEFVEDTGYVTVAERPLDPADYPGADPEMLVPGALVFHATSGPVDLGDFGQWWSYVPGASWRRPLGPGSSIEGLERHPVVQVSFVDARAYARWAGKALPTEAEWEFAARGGLDGAVFVWGDEHFPDGGPAANTWQGMFPWQNLELDGWARTSPVGSFPSNGYGLHDMAGNVWEWTTDFYRPRHPGDPEKSCCTPVDPRVTAKEESYDPLTPRVRIPRRVTKGGSHLCAPNYCFRYRPAARSPEAVDTATCHIGFRCVVRPGDGGRGAADRLARTAGDGHDIGEGHGK